MTEDERSLLETVAEAVTTLTAMLQAEQRLTNFMAVVTFAQLSDEAKMIMQAGLERMRGEMGADIKNDETQKKIHYYAEVRASAILAAVGAKKN